MISAKTEKANIEADELHAKRSRMFDTLQTGLDIYLKAELGEQVITMDGIINDHLLNEDKAKLVFRLMLTGHTDKAMKVLHGMYELASTEVIYEAVNAHFEGVK